MNKINIADGNITASESGLECMRMAEFDDKAVERIVKKLLNKASVFYFRLILFLLFKYILNEDVKLLKKKTINYISQ